VTHPTPAAPTHDAYDDAYFAVQIAKSDAKVRWEYSRLIAMGGIALPGTARVLDAACGAAPGLRYFDERVAHVVGLDVSASALHAARGLLPDARLVQADLDAPLPFGDRSFDLIVLREAIEHVRDGEATLRHCLRALRPGGCVAITTPNLWDARRPLFALTRRTWSGDADPTHTHLYTPREMAALLRRIGYCAVRIRTGFKPMVRVGGRRLPIRAVIPYPPLIGNGIVAFGWREAAS
jgi:SAM-dependent methyltransferase